MIGKRLLYCIIITVILAWSLHGCIITMPKGPITIDPQIPETIEIDVNDL